MKINSLPIRFFLLIIIFIITTSAANAQFRISVGGTVGGGFLKSNSPSVGSVTASLFIETNTALFAEVFPRLGLVFAKDFNAIIQNVEKPYFPYVRGS